MNISNNHKPIKISVIGELSGGSILVMGLLQQMLRQREFTNVTYNHFDHVSEEASAMAEAIGASDAIPSTAAMAEERLVPITLEFLPSSEFGRETLHSSLTHSAALLKELEPTLQGNTLLTQINDYLNSASVLTETIDQSSGAVDRRDRPSSIDPALIDASNSLASGTGGYTGMESTQAKIAPATIESIGLVVNDEKAAPPAMSAMDRVSAAFCAQPRQPIEPAVLEAAASDVLVRLQEYSLNPDDVGVVSKRELVREAALLTQLVEGKTFDLLGVAIQHAPLYADVTEYLRSQQKPAVRDSRHGREVNIQITGTHHSGKTLIGLLLGSTLKAKGVEDVTFSDNETSAVILADLEDKVTNPEFSLAPLGDVKVKIFETH